MILLYAIRKRNDNIILYNILKSINGIMFIYLILEYYFWVKNKNKNDFMNDDNIIINICRINMFYYYYYTNGITF